MARRSVAVSRRAMLAVSLALAATMTGAPRAHALPIGTQYFQDCSKAFLKNAGGLAGKRSKAMLKCSNALLACQLDDELGSGDFATCSIKVVESCQKSLDKVAATEDAIAGKLDKACSVLADHDFQTSVGLGFRRLAAECGSVHSAEDAYACMVDRVRCAVADIVETAAPRTYELFAASGLLALVPEATGCLDTRVAATPAGGDAELLADCQAAMQKALLKRTLKSPKDMSACVADALECRLHADRLLVNQAQPPACYADLKSCEKAATKLASLGDAKYDEPAFEACTGVSDADLLATLNFAAACPASTGIDDVVACVKGDGQSETFELIDDAAPRTCQLSQTSGLAAFGYGNFCAPECGNNVVEAGEACDDGNGDTNDTCTNSCQTGPTVHQSYSIPASAQPAHTPDGTLLNAVDPGSTIDTMFGTTTPDLNNAAYVRYRALGAGDPDAVLILVPGFAGGAHSLKIVAETMVAKAADAGNIVLEVWTFDRRTDQLEDDFGGELAEIEDDPELALDWYFGAELGMTLDPLLPRRAVFHQGSDIPFIANFTYNVFIRDIDDVVDAAAALPGAPTVFLGGHSLGTLFSARYAATDLDTGAGVVPGHTKVAGLVLFEGGGDSMPSAPPSSDALDLVIAKADGGLYHAVKNNDARCWDGTPCPGGDADCSALALPAGAVTNKCVSPVDAFAGGVISPEIHAVGDAVVLQARRSPDSLSLAQVDFGSGSAVNEVPGLSLLSFLPKGSAEATVGFFLDDDYSPEVSFQAGMGFSDNGVNTDLIDYYLAGPAGNDPYRLWKGIDWAMPAAAVPNHGPATGAFDINGQEKEITPVGNMLTMVRSGDRNIGDWYFPASGLGVTKELIVPADAGFVGGLDSSALSIGRGRPDIENLTQGPGIDIPIICFGGSVGISNTPGAFLPFAEDIATCASPSCDGSTPRVVTSDPIHPIYGGIDGGFEAYISEGYAHIDVVSSEDDVSHNQVYAPLLAFLERNTP